MKLATAPKTIVVAGEAQHVDVEVHGVWQEKLMQESPRPDGDILADDGGNIARLRCFDAMKRQRKPSKDAVIFGDVRGEFLVDRLQRLKFEMPVFQFLAVCLRTIVKLNYGLP